MLGHEGLAQVTKIYGEYQDEAINAKNAAVVNILHWIPKAEQLEQESENNRILAETQAENERIEEEQRIAREAVEAADLESTRELEEIQRKAAQETADLEARKRDTHLKGKIHREIAADIQTMLPFITDDDAKKLVKAMVKHQIRHITINY